jgi:hypothetical protein
MREFNFGQAGFQSRQSCQQMILTADDFQTAQLNTRGPPGPQVFIDLKAAYDRVCIDTLLDKLETRQTPSTVLNLISSLFSGCSTQVVVNGSLSKSIHLGTGLFQGSILSPFLFNTYIDDLAEQLNGRQPHKDARLYLYADDIRLGYKKGTKTTAIQKDLDDISGWAARNNMLPSISKSAYVADREIPLSLSGLRLPRTHSYKYLGIEMGVEGIDWATFMNRVCPKARKMLTFCQAIGDGWSEAIRIGIYKVFVRPVLEYGLPLFFFYQRFAETGSASQSIRTQVQTINKMIDDEHSLALSWIFNTRKPRKIHASLAGLPLYPDRLKYLAGSLILHLDRAPCSSILTVRRMDSRIFTGVIRLLSLTYRLDWISEYRRLPLINGKEQTWPSFGKGKLMELLTNVDRYGALANVCTKRSRNQSGMDLTLAIPNRPLRQLAVAWRLNIYPRGSYCPAPDCSSLPFNRGHACHLVDLYETRRQLSEKLKEKFALELSTRKNEKHHYTWLDFLLNEQEYDLFDRIRQNTAVTQSPKKKAVRVQD